MQKSISRAAVTWRLILSVVVVSSFISCEDSNTVGSGVVDSTKLRVDTLFVNDFEKVSKDIFSGNLINLPIGKYEDPLFGTFESIGYFKPNLIPVQDDSLTTSTSLKLFLKTTPKRVYGDTTSSVRYSLYRVTQRWRGKSILASDQISFDETDQVGSFLYSDQDSLVVNLSDSFLLDYASYVNNEDENRDSLYNFEFYGLAIVAENNTSQILYPNISESSFLTVDSEDDTLAVSFRDRGFTLERTNQPTFNERLLLNSDLDTYYKLNFEQLLADLGQENILKAELYLYEDTVQIKNSLPANHVRPDITFLGLRFVDNLQPVYDILFTTPDFEGFRDSLQNRFRIDITNHVNEYLFGSPGQKDLVLNLNFNGGIIYSTLLYDSSSTAALKPKIILTVAE